MNTMLDNIPFVVIKEYFFKNTASTMINFVKKIAAMAKEAFNNPDDNVAQDNSATDKNSKGVGSAKKEGNSMMDKIKSTFQDRGLKESVIDLPYQLYCGLRKKLFGNTYIFPYIVDESTIINSSGNTGEWPAPGEQGGLKGLITNATQMLGGLVTSLSGSQATPATLFPAPTWSPGNGGDPVEFKFDLVLINDHIVKSRNNYMCVNTIIHNNRQMQKAILMFPGALYELWLPTGQRHLMCTATFQLYPLGLNRMTPTGFFGGNSSTSGANFPIGVNQGNI